MLLSFRAAALAVFMACPALAAEEGFVDEPLRMFRTVALACPLGTVSLPGNTAYGPNQCLATCTSGCKTYGPNSHMPACTMDCTSFAPETTMASCTSDCICTAGCSMPACMNQCVGSVGATAENVPATQRGHLIFKGSASCPDGMAPIAGEEAYGPSQCLSECTSGCSTFGPNSAMPRCTHDCKAYAPDTSMPNCASGCVDLSARISTRYAPVIF